MTTNSHLTDASLATLASGERSARASELEHLGACTRCRRRLEATRQVVSALTLVPGGAADLSISLEDLARRAAARVSPKPPEIRPARALSRRTPGETLEAPAGLRAAAPPTRQWLFRAGSMEIDLQAFRQGPESRRLLGQALREDEPASELTLHLRGCSEGPVQVTRSDGRGLFRFEAVRGEDVQLVVEDDEEVWALRVGAVPEGVEG